MSGQSVETPNLPEQVVGVITSYSPGKADRCFGDVARMVKEQQGLGLDIPTPRLVFTGTSGSGVEKVAEAVMGLKIIPNVSYPLEMKFVHVERNDVVCSLNFNNKRYTYPTETQMCKKDVADRVKTISTDAENKIIMTVESAIVPDLLVTVNRIEDVSRLDGSDISIVVIGANNIPTADVFNRWRERPNHRPIGVLSKINLSDPPALCDVRNTLALPFLLTEVAIDEELGPDRLAKHAASTGVEAVMKKIGQALTEKYVERLQDMKWDLGGKHALLRQRCSELRWAIPSDDKAKIRVLEDLRKEFALILKCEIKNGCFRSNYVRAVNAFIQSSHATGARVLDMERFKYSLEKANERDKHVVVFDFLVGSQYSQRGFLCRELVGKITDSFESAVSKIVWDFSQYPEIAKFFAQVSKTVIHDKGRMTRGQVMDYLSTAQCFPSGADLIMVRDFPLPCGRCRSCLDIYGNQYGCQFYEPDQYPSLVSRISDKVLDMMSVKIQKMVEEILDEIPREIEKSLKDAPSACELVVEDPAVTEKRNTLEQQLETNEEYQGSITKALNVIATE